MSTHDQRDSSVGPTLAFKSSRLLSIVGKEDQHGLFALVVVASRGKTDELHVHLVPTQGPNHHLETQVAAFI